MKRTLKRGLKVLEIAKREGVGRSTAGVLTRSLVVMGWGGVNSATGRQRCPAHAGSSVLNPPPVASARPRRNTDADEMRPTHPS